MSYCATGRYDDVVFGSHFPVFVLQVSSSLQPVSAVHSGCSHFPVSVLQISPFLQSVLAVHFGSSVVAGSEQKPQSVLADVSE